MANIHKLIKIQENLLDSMFDVTESIKRGTTRGFVNEIDQETKELLRLAIVFEKLQPKYIELSPKCDGQMMLLTNSK